MPPPSVVVGHPGPGAPPPRFYLKNHGTRVARLHLLDWAVLVLLVALDAALNVIEPFHRFVGEDAVPGLRYPLKSNTVPVWAVPVVAVVVPVVIVVGIYLRRRNVYDLHHAILGKSLALPSPFLRTCAWCVLRYDNVTREVICHGDPGVIKEGYKSFPSGHTSWSFAGLGFLSWYLAGKIKAFDRGGHVAKLCIVAMPLLLAAMVAVSRVDDYWHHWQDVFTAGVLGLVVASFCYLQFFPPPSGDQGLWPHSYFEHMLTLEGEIEVEAAVGSSHHPSLTLDSSLGRAGMEMRTSSQALDTMESGRRF
ncbi:Lipid phosphate phosphatase 2 [Dichanthelium oligosanthes]|uniref:Lipid phosphate phosphatase 2 n=1 Tax=Dichanthelium oligosanthes TaxID=888268 RepID=A0A1E5WB60_9POAL|nr:Lipid phosphate phosphatase 2 [Dichanthelium oligosanthes]